MTGVAASCAYGAPAFETTPHRRSPALKQVPARCDCRDFVPVWSPLVPGPHAQVVAAGDLVAGAAQAGQHLVRRAGAGGLDVDQAHAQGLVAEGGVLQQSKDWADVRTAQVVVEPHVVQPPPAGKYVARRPALNSGRSGSTGRRGSNGCHRSAPSDRRGRERHGAARRRDRVESGSVDCGSYGAGWSMGTGRPLARSTIPGCVLGGVAPLLSSLP